MFPSNLHRNIVQLDRQISLLENECKNIEIEKKKKNFKPESSYSASSKISSARLNSPTVKVSVKKTDSSIKNRKPTPPVSARLQSNNSLPSHCTKTWGEAGNNLIGKKKKSCGFSKKVPVCSCQMLDGPHYNSKKEHQFVKCICCNEIPTSGLANDNFDEKKDHILHKELVFPNNGGAIEVTVTQKSNSEKEKSPITQKQTTRRSLDTDYQIDKDLEGCKCQVKGQKWSEILCEKSSKQKESNSGNCEKNKFQADEIKTTYKSSNFMNNNKKSEENFSCAYHNNNFKAVLEEKFEMPEKLNSQSNKSKRQTELNSNKFEKETQCALENHYYGEPVKDLKVPEKIFQFLLHVCHQLPSEILNKLPIEKETVSVIKEALTKICEDNKNICSDSSKNNTAHISAVVRHCENLNKENALLSQEIMAKDNALATMRKREDEYLSLIGSLKTSLEKTKGNAQEGIDAVKEMNIIKNKLLDQMKVSEALKKSHLKLQEIMEKCSLENDKLKTQIKIFQLEAQKHEVLLAGKEVEIKRYREEIQNFQRQISDHLAALKSNAQEMDVEKMVETIVQQSQILAQTDLDSLLPKDQKESPKVPNTLMHSSPTSTKTSVVNSSWKQISSIHDLDQSKANSDVVIYLNDENNDKDFFQVFGENSFSELITPKKAKNSSLEKLSLSDKKEIKNSSSFTSCLSVNDDHNSSKSSNRDSLISKESLFSGEEKSDEQLQKSNRVSLDKAQSTINEMLKNMKLKFTKEIFGTSLPSCTTEDFLDISQISSISPL